VSRALTLASELRLGTNVQLVPNSRTYPDRAFFLGGVTSMRGYVQDSLVPQDIADQIASGKTPIDKVAFRGGDFMINPKVELRIPVRPPVGTVLFVDMGNVWQDPSYILDHGISLRTTAGSGLRVDTPIGPLAFDYGVNMSRILAGPNSARRQYEDFGAFHFAIGLF
jgi:outer membrane translocation and assembly module TamA